MEWHIDALQTVHQKLRDRLASRQLSALLHVQSMFHMSFIQFSVNIVFDYNVPEGLRLRYESHQGLAANTATRVSVNQSQQVNDSKTHWQADRKLTRQANESHLCKCKCKCKQSFMICRQGQCVSVLASQTFFKLAAELRCSRCSFVKVSIAWACLGRTEHSPSSVSSPEQSFLRSC